MRQPRAEDPLHRDLGRLQPSDGIEERVDRDHSSASPCTSITGGRCRTSAASSSAPSSAPEKPRIAAGARARRGPTMECHHRALREAEQGHGAVVQSISGEFLVEKGVHQRCGATDAGQHRRRPAVLEAEPLAAIGREVAGLRPIGRHEPRMRQVAGEQRRQLDEVVPIGAHPVQQDHQLTRRAARAGPEARAASTAPCPVPFVVTGALRGPVAAIMIRLEATLNPSAAALWRGSAEPA